LRERRSRRFSNFSISSHPVEAAVAEAPGVLVPHLDERADAPDHLLAHGVERAPRPLALRPVAGIAQDVA
jgi:hypothetical protein